MQHIFQNIQGWFDGLDFDFYNMIIESLPQSFNFAEVGVWKGRSLSYFVVESLNRGKHGNIYAVDHWQGSDEHKDKTNMAYEPMLEQSDALYNTYIQNTIELQPYITNIRLPSDQAYLKFEDKYFDAVFIDGSHTYEDVYKDISNWFPKVKDGGFFSGHDWSWGSVKKAVVDYANNNKKQIYCKANVWRIV